MKALLTKFYSKENQEVIKEVDVMHYSTCLPFFTDDISKGKISKTTFVARRTIAEVLYNLGIGKVSPHYLDVEAVITVTSSHNGAVDEYYIICSTTSYKERLEKLLDSMKDTSDK